jgi:uncharacterized protein (DUF1810 family)
MTLFAQVDTADDVFAYAIQKYFSGQPDNSTLQRLSWRDA